MAASINTNMPAMTAQRHLGATQGLFHRTVERLSSGLRINSARDDAAGLFLSERLKNQVRGLQQASRNAQDGISFLQTAEGGLSVQHDILMRLRELAVQSANGIMTDADRALSIAPEAKALMEELDRISGTTSFNGTKLLDGKMGGAQVTLGTNVSRVDINGALVSEAVTTNDVAGTDLITNYGIESIQAKSATKDPKAYAILTTAYDATTDSVDVTVEELDPTDGTAAALSSQTITINDVSSIKGTQLLKFSDYDINIYVNGAIGTDGAGAAQALDRTAGTFNNVAFTVSSNLKLMDTDDTTVGTIDTTSVLSEGLEGVKLQVGANNVDSDQLTLLNMNAADAAQLGLKATANLGTDTDADNVLDTFTTSTITVADGLSTQKGAQLAIDVIDEAIEQVSTQRSKIGAYQNRMDYTVTNLGVAAENQQAAASRITDADVAAEVSEMVRTQILSQSAMAILAQANAAPQALLSLFR
jgi:flagellin